MLAMTRFPTAGGFSSTMRPTILTGFQAQWKKPALTVFYREKYDGTMALGVMEGYGNLFWKDGSHYSGQVKQLQMLSKVASRCDETVWLLVIKKETEKHGNHCHKHTIATMHLCSFHANVFLSFILLLYLILFLSSSQTTRRMEREPFSTLTETSSSVIGWKKERRAMES